MRSPDRRLGSREAWTIALLWTVAIVARLVVGPHVVDDAYITMRYSRNLASSGALAYNPPDAVLGSSTPLWTGVLAASTFTGARPENAAVVLSGVADLATIALIVMYGGRTFAATAAGLTIAAWPAYLAYGVSGMETSLYVLLVVSFVTALSRGAVGNAAAASALGALCRPDGALLPVLGCAWLAATKSRGVALRFCGIVVVLCTPWLVYALITFGSIVPASVSAKAAADVPWFLSLQNLGAYFLTGVYAPLTALALAGAALAMLEGDAFWRLWMLWVGAYVAGMTAANGFTHFPWYFVPILPVLNAAAAAAVERGCREWMPSRYLTRRRVPGRLALTAALAIVLLSRAPVLRAHLDAQAAGRETLYASLARELAVVDGRCTVAATEIGTIGYHYPGRILDLVGLVSPEAVRRPADELLAEKQPRWVVTYDTHFDRRAATSQSFIRLYETRTRVRVGEARSLEVYERRDRAGCAQ